MSGSAPDGPGGLGGRALPTPAVPPSAITAHTAPFWAGLAEGMLRLLRCDDCGGVIWYPRPLCPHCHGARATWFDASGQGAIYSFTVVRRGSGVYADAAPYVVAYVELDEGPRVLTNIVDWAARDLRVGAPVEAVLTAVADGAPLLRFRLR
jgi:uncharacterized OB-fold protein